MQFIIYQIVVKYQEKENVNVTMVDAFVMHGAKVIERVEDEQDELGLVTFKHLYRTNITRINPKCFHSTKSVMIVDNHLPRKCLHRQTCRNVHVNSEQGYFLHYRFGNHKKSNDFHIIYDPVLLKYKDRVEEIVIKNLNEIYS